MMQRLSISTKLWYVISTAVLLIGGMTVSYLIGYSNSPGPYLPAEDSFDYHNHHCYPLKTPVAGSYNPSEVWGN